jgi:uncharacterized membrane protein YesL
VERLEDGDGMTVHPLRGDAQPALGWAGRAMQMLGAVWSLVLVNLLFLAGAIAGLIVLGVMPAATAAVSVLLRNADGIDRDGGATRIFLRTYRREFRRANLTGAPLLAAAALLTADALVVLTAAAAVLVVLTGIVAVTLLARYDDRPAAVLRYALGIALTAPLTATGVVLALASCGIIAAVLPVFVPLAGASLPLGIAARLIDRRLRTLDSGHPDH